MSMSSARSLFSHLVSATSRPRRPALLQGLQQKRTYVDLNRPRPPSLPAKEQREFEELQRKAASGDGPVHPDAPAPMAAEFEGEVNPATGERGGPKREPARKWTDEGDWSFKGRVSDF